MFNVSPLASIVLSLCKNVRYYLHVYNTNPDDRDFSWGPDDRDFSWGAAKGFAKPLNLNYYAQLDSKISHMFISRSVKYLS